MATLVSKPISFAPLPEPRSGSCMAIIDHSVYLWGGHTQLLFDDEGETYPVEEILPNTDDHFIDVYNILHNRWQQYSTYGDVPNLGNGSTFTPFG